MSRLYRLVWNCALGAWQVVSERSVQRRACGVRSGAFGTPTKVWRRHALAAALAAGAVGNIQAQSACSLTDATVTCVGQSSPLGYEHEVSGRTLAVGDVAHITARLAPGNPTGTLAMGGMPLADGLNILHDGTSLNLLNSVDPQVNFWNGNGLASPGVAGGGDGVWRQANANWADATGSDTGVRTPNDAFAVFGGASGTVTVDNVNGAQPIRAQGMQFAVNGYRLQGNQIELVPLVGDLPSDLAVIRVGDGTQASAPWTATIASSLAGVGFEKRDPGMLVLTGANVFTGGMRITQGTVSIQTDANLGLSPARLELDGGDLRVTGSNFVVLSRALTLGEAGGGIDVNQAGHTLVQSGVISGEGGLTKLGAGTLFLLGNNTYSGGTTVSAGTLRAAVASVRGDVLNNATLDLYAQSGNATFSGAISGTGGLIKSGSGTLTLTGSKTYTGGITIEAGTLRGHHGSLSGDIVNNGGLVFDQQLDGAHTGNISGTGSFSKVGAGTLTLTGTNTHTGGTLIQNGSIVLGAGGSLALDGLVDVAGSNASLVLESGDTSIGALRGVAGSQVALGARTLTLAGAQSEVYAGSIRGAGGLVRAGSGTQTLSGELTYTGSTTVTSGTLALEGAAGLAQTSQVIVDGGTLDLSQITDATIGTLDGAGGNVALGARTLAVSQGSYAGAIAGSGGLNKMGTGALTLNGVNTYTGPTHVQAGRLDIGGTAAHASASLASDVTVANGATLGGFGSITGDVGIAAGGRLAPGNPTGTLTINGNLTLAQGSMMDAHFGAPNQAPALPGQGHNVQVNGDLALFGVQLTPNDTGGFGPGLYNLYTYTGTLSLANGGITAPVGYGIQTLTADRQINLINAQGVAFNVWNGNGLASPDRQGGGSGIWARANANWATATGDLTGIRAPEDAFVVFAGAAGTVTVDDVDGAQQVATRGMQFASDGYRLAGDRIDLVAPAMDQRSEIRVGNGGDNLGWVATIENVLAGNSLDKTGQGTLVLRGTNTYLGGTRISEGVLSVSSDASLGEASGGIELAGGTLRVTGMAYAGSARAIELQQASGIDVVEAGHTLTLSGELSGLGGLVKLGAGTLVLTGANAYEGGTLISGGVLRGDTASLRGDIVNHASLQFQQAVDGTYAGVVSGPGGLTKAGAGTLTLTGAHTYTGGTTVLEGTLRGDTVSLQGAIANHAEVVFDQDADGVYAGALSGDGVLVKQGTGTLTLSGLSSYLGGTEVREGTLRVGDGATSGSLSGNIQVDTAGTLAFDRTDSQLYAAMLTGTGTIDKRGTGVLTLLGDSAAFGGATLVSAGTLQVDGGLGGTTTVREGATLSGAGSLGSVTVASGGTLSPGNAVSPTGTLRVDGDLSFEAGATYRVHALADGVHDTVRAGGQARLAGSVVHLGDEGIYAPSTSYTILQADGGLSGEFVAVSSDRAFLAPSLDYVDNRVDLRVDLKQVPGEGGRPIRFADAASTGNQRAVADALESLPGDNALYTRVLNLNEGEPAAVFDSLSGETHASMGSALHGVTDSFVQVPMSRLRANLGAQLQPGQPTAQLGTDVAGASALPSSSAQPVWAQVFGHWRTRDGDGNAARYTQTDGGLYVGGDHEVGNGWRLGAALGYTDTRTRTRSRASSAEADSYSAAVYGGKAFEKGPGKLKVSMGAAYTWHDIDTKRQANAAGVSQTLEADYRASTAQVFGEVGYVVPINTRVSVEPFLGAGYNDQRTRGFSESGGDGALQGKGARNDTTTTTTGVRLQTELGSGTVQGRVHGAVGWRHAFGDVIPRSTMAFEGSRSFIVAGAPIARDAAVFELGAEVAVGKGKTVGLSYNGQVGGGSRQHAATLGVMLRF